MTASSHRAARARLRALLRGTLAAILLVLSATPAAAEHQTLAQIIARWREYVEQFRNVPREIRVPEAKKFFLTIPWEDYDYLCREGSPGVGPDSVAILQYVVGYRLEVGPLPVAVMAPFIASPNYAVPCRAPMLVWIYQHRDSLSAEDRALLAAAHLEAASYPGLPKSFETQLYNGAAALVATDSLMQGMMAWARSDDAELAGRAVRMLANSADPRSPDSLAARAQVYFETGSPVLDQVLVHCRLGCAELALPTFIAAIGHPRSDQQWRLALEATARVPRMDAAQALLDHYADGGTIADSTFAASGEVRAHYYGLWLATRIAEPHLIAWLREGNEAHAELAVELLDRALRFGPMDNDSEVAAGLAAWAERAPGEKVERARAVLERALHPPQSAPAPRASARDSTASPPEPE